MSCLKKARNRVVCFLFFTIAFVHNTLSTPTPPLTLHLLRDSIVSVNPFVYVYREEQSKKTFEQILVMDEANFTPLNSPLYYFSQEPDISIYWLRCTIQNHDSVDYRGYFYFLTGLDSVEMFQSRSNNRWKKSLTSVLLPTQERELYLSQELTFPAILSPGIQTIYFRIVSTSAWSKSRSAILLNLAEEKSFINYFLEYRHYHGVALGMITVMIIFHFFIYFFLQDKTYLVFLFNVSITFLFLFMMKHYHEEVQMLAPLLPTLRYIHDPAGVLVAMSALMFTMSFLNTRQTDIIMHRLMRWLCVGLGFLILMMVFLIRLDWMNQISMILGIVTSIVVIIASIRGMSSNKFAWYILVGFMFVFFVPVMYILQFVGSFPFESTASDFHYFSEAFRSIVFAVGIANRFYFIKKEAARQQLEKNALELEKEKQIRAERERIAQDLHDSVGAQLALLSRGLQRLSDQDNYSKKYVEELSGTAALATSDLRNTIWAIEKEVVTLEEFSNKITNMFWRYAEMYAINFEVHPPANATHLSLRSEVAVNAFRIVQEAISNSIKHSRAKKLLFFIQPLERNLFRFCIEDNGIGFDSQKVDRENHFGLRNMERRAQQLHSNLQLITTEGGGTKICFDLSVEVS